MSKISPTRGRHDQVGYLDGGTVRLGKTYAGEPDQLVKELADDGAIAAAAAGRLVDGVRAFAAGICTDDEVAALEPTTFFERWAGAVPALLNDLGQDNAYEGPRSIDPDALEQVSVPMLVLRGEQTLLTSLWGESAEHVARHVPDTHIRAVGRWPLSAGARTRAPFRGADLLHRVGPPAGLTGPHARPGAPRPGSPSGARIRNRGQPARRSVYAAPAHAADTTCSVGPEGGRRADCG